MNASPHMIRARAAVFGAALAAMLGLSGCATQMPAYHSEVDVLNARGEPTARLKNDDGTTTLEYATQPDGTTRLMVQVDANGLVVRQWDALSRRGLEQVRPGMTKDDVARLLGPRHAEKTIEGTNREVWDWNIRHRGRGIATLFRVHFTDGKVSFTTRVRVYPEGEVIVERDPYRYYPYPVYPYGPSYWLWVDPWPRVYLYGGWHGGWRGGHGPHHGGGGFRGGGRHR